MRKRKESQISPGLSSHFFFLNTSFFIRNMINAIHTIRSPNRIMHNAPPVLIRSTAATTIISNIIAKIVNNIIFFTLLSSQKELKKKRILYITFIETGFPTLSFDRFHLQCPHNLANRDCRIKTIRRYFASPFKKIFFKIRIDVYIVR